MSDQNFQTPPLPPQAPTFTPPPVSAVQPSENVSPAVSQEQPEQVGELPSDNFAARFNLSTNIYKTKVMAGILAGVAVLGMLMGAMMFGGSAPKKAAPANSGGLSGVIRNPDILEKLQRCGMVPESYPCIVYLVNHSRNDRLAEDFFDDAIKLTGRQKFLIQIENKQYTKTRIPPGHIAQIKIPPLR